MAEESSAPKFEIKKWNAVALWSWEMEQDTCAIFEKCVQCQANDMDENEACPPAFGQCNHAFHLHCINKWINNSNTCPLCNAPWVQSNSHK